MNIDRRAGTKFARQLQPGLLPVDADHLARAQATRETRTVETESTGSQDHNALTLVKLSRLQALKYGSHRTVERSSLLIRECVGDFEDRMIGRQVVVVRKGPQKIRIFATTWPEQRA